MNKPTINENELRQFYGSERYYRGQLVPGIVYTEGIHYLAMNGANWLVTSVLSYQLSPKVKKNKRLQEFQLWQLRVNPDKSAELTCREDLGEPPIITEKIPFTDFPLKEIDLYVEEGSIDGKNVVKVFMLTTER